MPTFILTSPDGKEYELTAPEGATQEQIAAVAQRMAHGASKPATTPEEPYNPAAEMSLVDRARAGFGKAFADLGRGARQVIAEAGANQSDAAIARGLVPVGRAEQAAEQAAALQAEEVAARQRDAPLMATGAGRIGNVAGNIAIAVPTMAIPGAATVRGAAAVGAGLGALQPTVEGESRAANTALGAATGAVGQRVGEALGAGASGIVRARQARAAAPRNRTLEAAQKLGVRVPAAQSNPTVSNRVLQSIGGKTAIQASAARNNAEVLEQVAARTLGVDEITDQTLAQVEKAGGAAYAAAAAAGDVPLGTPFTAKLDTLAGKLRSRIAPNKEPSAAQKEIDAYLKSEPLADAADVVHEVQVLREEASGLFRSANAADKQLARVKRGIADALDDALQKHLDGTAPGVAQQYKEARVLLAKMHDIKAAYTPGGGIDVNVLKRIDKKTSGRRLTGELATVTRAAAAFPKAFGPVEQGANITDLVRFGGLAGLGGASGGLLGSEDPRLQAIGGAIAPFAARGLARTNYLGRPSQRANSLLSLTLQSGRGLVRPAGLAGAGLVDFPEEQPLEPPFR